MMMMNISFKMASLVVLLAIIACAELSWIGGVEAKQHCLTDDDCHRPIFCSRYKTVVCKDGRCVCVPKGSTPIPPDPPTLSPSDPPTLSPSA